MGNLRDETHNLFSEANKNTNVTEAKLKGEIEKLNGRCDNLQSQIKSIEDENMRILQTHKELAQESLLSKQDFDFEEASTDFTGESIDEYEDD